MNAAARLLNQGTLSRGWILSVLMTRSQTILAFLLMAVVINALAIVYCTNLTRSVHASLQQASVEQDKIHAEWQQLLLEQGTLTTQARVQEIAEQRLGMVLPSHQSTVIINE